MLSGGVMPPLLRFGESTSIVPPAQGGHLSVHRLTSAAGFSRAGSKQDYPFLRQRNATAEIPVERSQIVAGSGTTCKLMSSNVKSLPTGYVTRSTSWMVALVAVPEFHTASNFTHCPVWLGS